MKESEAQFQAKVVELAELLGWRVYHVRNVHGQLRNSTAVGFPDLCMARGGRVIFIECKSVKGKRTYEQVMWGAAIDPEPDDLATHEYHLWTPETDWDVIQGTLRASGT